MAYSIEQWLQQDPEPNYIAEIQQLQADNATDKLHELFAERLQFGTAGIRGEMGPGPNRMNRSVVRRTSLAIANYLKEQQIQSPSVVIGYDGRRHSDVFARDAAMLMAREGIAVHIFDYLVPTPLLAHAVVALQCDAGIMITASHNPPQDNGYKVYWSNGAQIIPPHDKGISAQLDALPLTPIELPTSSSLVQKVKPQIAKAYLGAVQALRVHHETGAKIVYTPLHGVGGVWVEKCLSTAGHNDLHVVEEQAQPDGDFPFAPFPNPEDAVSMDLAFALAKKVQADIVIANDPDADRLAVSVARHGEYHKLTGDQVGLLLAYDLLAHGSWGERPLVATTVVSSSQLQDIAAYYKAEYAETLTGFKWIANKAILHDQQGGRFVIGFEEALGYSVSSVARDKDGVSAALLIADLASWAKGQNKTLFDLLQELYLQFGFALSEQISIKKPGLQGKQDIQQMLFRLRQHPPQSIGDIPVLVTRDIQTGLRTDMQTGETTSIDLPKSNVLIYHLADNSRVIVRPSGTEPKIKFYFEVKAKMQDLSEYAAAAARCAAKITTLKHSLLQVLDS